MTSAEPSASLTEILGRFVAETPGDAIPEPVRTRARISLVHNLCVALAGRSTHPVANAYARRYHGSPADATLLMDGSCVDPEAAAFANGSLFHARSQDDTHPGSTSHPGAPVMAAALAVAEAEGRSGRAFIDAVILGYEALCRIGRDFDEQVTGRGFRSAAVFGGFGAAAAAARLMHLPAEKAGHALSFAAHQAGGLAQVWVEGSPEYPIQLGFAARNGVVSARLASLGMSAARQAVDGESGFHVAYAGTNAPATEALEGLGAKWQFAEVTVKAFPVCAILQGPLDLCEDMLQTVNGADVVRIVVELNPFEADYPGVDNPGPQFASPTAAKMSAQFCLGVMALDRHLRFDDLSRLDDADIGEMASRIEVRRVTEIPPRLCALAIELSDGRRIEGRVSEPAGRPEFSEISGFARRMAPEMEMTEAATGRLLDTVQAIDNLPDLRPLLDACLCRDG